MSVHDIRAVVTGVSGRMGSTLVRMIRDEKGMAVAGGTERAGSSSLGVDVGTAARLDALGVPVLADLGEALEQGKAQVVIDFTSAEASLVHARLCADRGVPMVVGSTGFSVAQRSELKALSHRVAMVVAPNTSIGVNLVVKMAGVLARALGEDFDVEVLETHHRLKKDAPSGTALRLAEELASALGRGSTDFALSRQGQVGPRSKREIGIQAIRGGDVVGDHTVFFLGDGERVELTHRATSRDTFAHGAIRAARWVAERSPGLYDMLDVLEPVE